MKSTKKKITLIVVCAIIALVLICVISAVVYLLRIYNEAYEHVDIVERSDEYQMPDYPDLDFESTGPDTTATAPETTVPNTESDTSAPETTGTEPSEDTTAVPETTLPTYTPPEFDSNDTTSAEETDPPETEPEYIYIPPPMDPNASFANSPNAISVYGGVPIYKVDQKHKDIVNILILGTDSRDVTVERGRTDTMIVMSYNKVTGEIKMVSFLRDLLVPIEGWYWNRLNAAYVFGGVGLTINTMNQLFGLDIQHFLVIDLNGTRNFIDHIGGIDLKLTAEEAAYYNGLYKTAYTEGTCHLNGTLAMAHIRNRALDNDFGRTQRQRDVVTAIMQKLLSQKSLAEILDLLNYTTSIVKTNIDALTMTSLATSIVNNKNSISLSTLAVPFSDAYQFAWYNGMAVISFDINNANIRINEYLKP